MTDSNNVKLQEGKEYTGFTAFILNRDVFIITDQVNKSQTLCKTILNKLEIFITQNNVDELYRRLRRANIQLKKTTDNREYYEIYGENFGGGGDFLDEHKTIVISLND